MTTKHSYLQLLTRVLVMITQLTDCSPLLRAKFSKSSLRMRVSMFYRWHLSACEIYRLRTL